ncbi:error-prone DNA polymerase [Gluconobacter kondonii]|uniref:Error-prone DNA polymerase n=1 Tax=Gluconobacter kondonii TaxID=941463 RepID=A0ABQ5WX00_9PROT|nr:error-prone DNA polymerase [Gluconobacter kondonii]GBR41759.1 DNA polymerase III subunit alpha [Gluconobacter kondonii NBRC 3266]GLQ67445.1 error-prone DNA polymerase 3 [Gluconobacter kondonii]
MSAPYVELQVTSSFSFLRSGSQPDELIFQAKALGYDTIGLTDWNTVAGAIRAHLAAREAGLRLLPGCRLALRDGSALLAYPRNRAGWAGLCQLLTLGHHRGEREVFLLGWEDLVGAAPDLLLILLPPEDLAALPGHVQSLLDLPGHRAGEEETRFVALTVLRQPGDLARLHALAGFCTARGLACVVTGDVLYHDARRHVLQDVVTAIREGCTVDALGNRRHVHADRHLKAPEEQARLFAAFPDALANTRRIAGACAFSLDDLTYQYPTETERTGESAQDTLTRLVEAALPRRYPAGAPPDVEAQIAHELRLIGSLAYAPYFLTVNTIVRHARSLGIVCQGRGSAANSAVCYVLGITSIDPVRSGLLFERFISAERQEPPDIDVDFESDRREEVIQWIYRHYGRHRAALCATVQRYQPKGALREVGKVLGLPEDLTGQLSRHIASSLADPDLCKARSADLGLNLKDRRLSLTYHLARQLLGFPRQLGTHPGGFVLTEDRLDELVPLMPTAMDGRQIIVWDKDDIDVLRFMKVDVLGLGMLGCLRRGFELLHTVYQTCMDLASIPAEDPQTYRMIQKADTLGTFQIESRAQMSMLPRMKPRTFYDLVIQVAIVRPGPIQGDMVHPYLRRREKLEPVTYPSETLRGILGKTLGVPLFQEQAMQVAIHCAGFTPGEADQLRRAMATFKMTGGVSPFRDQLVNGMLANGYEQDFAEQTFAQLEGFGSYGFPESHAASFALIAYASAWMKHHYPDVFCAALLNSQPMGFYAPSQIVQDAQRHGVEVRPICINASRWDCTLERSGTSLRKAVMMGFRMVRGLANGHGAALIAARMPDYESIDDVWRRADVPVSALECLAEADAFRVFGQMRRAALWSIKGLADTALPLFDAADRGRNFPLPEVIEPEIVLPQMSERALVHEDYRATGLSLNGHPVAFLREGLRKEGIVRCGDLPYLRDGRRIQLTGLVLMRQRPGTANGTMFVTIEDETGTANLIVWKDVQEKHRLPLLASRLLACKGRLQKEGDVIHVVVLSLEDRTPLLQGSELLKARDFR